MSAGDIAREFLSALWDGERPDDETLSRALDRLLFQSHQISYDGGTNDDLDPPSIDGPALYRAVAVRFPDYGMYPACDPLDSIEDGSMLEDAIDDLADITRDLREVIWADENLGSGDAAFYLRLHFGHWGRHARHLSSYLHARQYG